MDIYTLRELLGWCLLINVGIMFLSTVSLILMRGWVSRLHANMFELDETWVRQGYFSYLANYKIAVIVLNLVPWISLNLMGS